MSSNSDAKDIGESINTSRRQFLQSAQELVAIGLEIEKRLEFLESISMDLIPKDYDGVKLATSRRLQTLIIKCLLEDDRLIGSVSNFVTQLQLPVHMSAGILQIFESLEERLRESLNHFISYYGSKATIGRLRRILLANQYVAVHDEIIDKIDSLRGEDGGWDTHKMKEYKENPHSSPIIPEKSLFIPDSVAIGTEDTPSDQEVSGCGVTLIISCSNFKMTIHIDGIIKDMVGSLQEFVRKVMNLVQELSLPSGMIHHFERMCSTLDQLTEERTRTLLMDVIKECLHSVGTPDTVKGLQNCGLVARETVSSSRAHITLSETETEEERLEVARTLGLESYAAPTYAQVVKLSIADWK